jgi:protocatechuate 3,4-dioxygenase beta subunit
MSHDHDAHDLGLAADLEAIDKQLRARRSVLRLLGLSGMGLVATACGGGGSSETTTTTTDTTSGSTDSSGSSACSVTPTETQGPYPADGSNSSNGVLRNVLATSGVVRADIRPSFGGVSSNVAAGVPVTLAIQLVNTNNSCAPLAGYAIYIWHRTQSGQYSLYDLPNENYLRGVAVTDSTGLATFTTIFPGCYSGRWPHIHFEVYPSLPVATSYVNKILTSQFALPSATCSVVYNMASGYTSSRSNFLSISLSSDNVFGDNTSAQITAMTPVFTGDVTNGYSAAVTVGLAR